MKFTVSNDVSAAGTFFVGEVHTTFDTLVSVFGPPTSGPSSDNKADVEWSILFANGTVATIYNYKDGVAYLGHEGLHPEEITDWHVGGRNQHALELVMEVLSTLIED